MVKLVKDIPPPGKGGRPRVDWDAVAARLREHPGEWGRLDDVSRSTSTHIRQGRISAFQPAEDWEAETRVDHTLPIASRGTLYVRYVGK